jgi:hypothetical protein
MLKERFLNMSRRNNVIIAGGYAAKLWHLISSDISIDRGLIEHARFVCRNHVLDVNESIFSTASFERLQSFLNQVAKNSAFPLSIVDGVTNIH